LHPYFSTVYAKQKSRDIIHTPNSHAVLNMVETYGGTTTARRTKNGGNMVETTWWRWKTKIPPKTNFSHLKTRVGFHFSFHPVVPTTFFHHDFPPRKNRRRRPIIIIIYSLYFFIKKRKTNIL
jgi:hypothetical protein